MNIYELHGFKDKNDCMSKLAEEFNVPIEVIIVTAENCDPEKDFDTFYLEAGCDANDYWKQEI